MNHKSRLKSAGSRVPALAPKAQPKPYVPTEQESAAAQRLLDRKSCRPPSPRFKVAYKGTVTNIEADHAHPASNFVLLADALSTGNLRFASGLLNQIADVSRSGSQLTANDVNFMLATIHEIGPKDPTEALLAIQMAAVHNAVMVAARRLNHVENIPQQDSTSNALNKLSRTFCAQIEALKRYRADGEQKVTVQHHHVNVSAHKAVVGITQGGGGTHENTSQSHAPSPTDERRPTLLSHEQAFPMPLQSSGGERPECVPHARGSSGSAEGERKRRMAARDDDE